MIGAIIGDIVGSRFEFNNYRKKDFELFTKECFFTDDTVMTLAIAMAVKEYKKDGKNLGDNAVYYMQTIGRHYPNCGYGGRFYQWMYSQNPTPYNSYGNGSAMRVSACGRFAESLEEAKFLSKAVTEVTHNHPEGLKGAEAVACCIYLAKTGSNKEQIQRFVEENYYQLNFTVEQIRKTYEFNETCQQTVPQAIKAFLESESFEDAIKTAVSIGGDSDTLTAITGSIAEVYFGVDDKIKRKAINYLDERLKRILNQLEK